MFSAVPPLAMCLVGLRFLCGVQLDALGVIGWFEFLRSPILFHLGWVFLTAGALELFQGWQRTLFRTLWLFTIATITFIELAANTLFKTSHTVLDWALLRYAIGNLGEVLQVLKSIQDPIAFAVVFAVITAILVVAFGWIDRRQNHRRDDRPNLWPWIAGIAALVLSLVPTSNVRHARSAARPVLANVFISSFDDPELSTTPMQPSTPSLISVQDTHPNLVLIGLESMRARSTTVYNPELKTTPFLAELAEDSVVIERGYTNFVHTTKAWVSIWCGIHPIPTMQVVESDREGAIPAKCLPHLLEEHGYQTAAFLSSTIHFENKDRLIGNMGFDTLLHPDLMDTDRFEVANYFGYEDAILLEPSETWLTSHEEPFLAFYMTGTPHHEYLAPAKRYGPQKFSNDDETNRYLSSVNYVDRFLEELFDQYKRLGLYENTVFILVGDHGEGLGEHRSKYHNDCVYEECTRIPYILHAPGLKGRVPHAEQIDLLPTSAELLGFELDREVLGRSLLRGGAPNTVYVSCWYERKCISSIRDGIKIIHTFDDRPDAVFDIEADPGEREDIAGQDPARDVQRREELIAWYRETLGGYRAWNDLQ